MLVLGIESSCDETGVAIVETTSGGLPTLRADALHSQVALHADYGGVVPELASRDHVRRVLPLLRQALDAARLNIAALDVIAYTRGPGLAGALLVGAGVAVSLAQALDKPSLGIHHLEGHLLSPFLDQRPGASAPVMPFIALLVSGGHTQLLRVDGVGVYTLLGDTIDDAAGEAYDKVAKMLDLGYPGGAALARLAESGDALVHRLPRPLLNRRGHDFSFAGLKTAAATVLRRLGEAPSLTDRADLAAGVQAAINEVLVSKTIGAAEAAGVDRIVVAGGVGANADLRAALRRECGRRNWSLHFPPLTLCSDNGAMIAMAAALRLQHGLADELRSDGTFDVRPRWPLAAVS